MDCIQVANNPSLPYAKASQGERARHTEVRHSAGGRGDGEGVGGAMATRIIVGD